MGQLSGWSTAEKQRKRKVVIQELGAATTHTIKGSQPIADKSEHTFQLPSLKFLSKVGTRSPARVAKGERKDTGTLSLPGLWIAQCSAGLQTKWMLSKCVLKKGVDFYWLDIFLIFSVNYTGILDREIIFGYEGFDIKMT